MTEPNRLAPQPAQKRVLSRFMWPQASQAIPVGVGTAARSDAVGPAPSGAPQLRQKRAASLFWVWHFAQALTIERPSWRFRVGAHGDAVPAQRTRFLGLQSPAVHRRTKETIQFFVTGCKRLRAATLLG